MRASYDSIDNKQKMCEKVNKGITFIQFFHSTRLHSTELFKIFFSLLTLQLLFCKKLVGREKIIIYLYLIVLVLEISQINYIKFIKIIILLQIYIEYKILIQIYVVCFVFYSVYTKLIQKINSYLS